MKKLILSIILCLSIIGFSMPALGENGSMEPIFRKAFEGKDGGEPGSKEPLFKSATAPTQKSGGAKLLCVSKQELKGEETVASCMAKGERFAVMDAYGIVRILTSEEIELTKAFNPKAFETRAFGMRYQRLSPALPSIPATPEQ